MNDTNLRGVKLLKAAMNQIVSHPETWCQYVFHSHCGTRHCVAGWCQILAGQKPDDETARYDAQEALGISYAEADWLFDPCRTLEELHDYTAELSGVCSTPGKQLPLFDLN